MTVSHIPGRTTATASRETRDFSTPTHVYDIDREVDPIMAEAKRNPSQRAATTLSKDGALNVVLMAIAGGAEVPDHRAHGSAIVQVLRGHLRVHFSDADVDLPSGSAMSLADGVPHRLAAVTDCAMLLVVASR